MVERIKLSDVKPDAAPSRDMVLSIRLSAQEREQIDKAASAQGFSGPSEFVRKAILMLIQADKD